MRSNVSINLIRTILNHPKQEYNAFQRIWVSDIIQGVFLLISQYSNYSQHFAIGEEIQ